MKLYYFETPNPRKPCAVARHLGLPVEFVRIDLSKGENRTPEFLAVNPNGKVPALADGDTKIWESHAIMIYLAHKAKSDMWPADDLAKIEIVKWLQWDTAHFSRHGQRLFWQRYVKSAFGMGAPDEAEIAEATEFFLRFAKVLDDHLKGRDYLVGRHLTVADFGVASLLPNAAEAKLPLDDFSEIRRWHDSLMQLEAWRSPFPAMAAAA